MSESVSFNLQAFEPYDGGAGARLAVTATTGSVAIPGLAGGLQDERSRVVVSNSGSFSAYVRFGVSGVVATTSSYEILPGSQQVLKPAQRGPGAIVIAAICDTAKTTTINICAGIGT